MASEKIQKLSGIAVKHETWTTNNVGGFASGLNVNNNPIINVVRTDDPNATTFCFVTATSPGVQWVLVKNATSSAAITNTQVTCKITYLI